MTWDDGKLRQIVIVTPNLQPYVWNANFFTISCNFMNFMFINSHSVQGDPVQGFIVVSCILSGNTQCADAEAWCSGQQLKTWTDNQLVIPPRIVAEYWSSVPEDLVESSVMMSTFNIYLDLCCLFLSSERRLYVLPEPWFWWNIFWSTELHCDTCTVKYRVHVKWTCA